MNKKPTLSICIPTYNRAEYLDICLGSIVTQDVFSEGDIEIVVSNNASTDNTESVVLKYMEKYKGAISYYCNDENIKDLNFPSVLGHASGIYRKMCNDTCVFHPGSLSEILDTVKANIDGKPVLFFLNASRDACCKRITCNGLDCFVNKVSYFSTWTALFGLWEDDWKAIDNPRDGCELKLWQTKVLLENVNEKGSVFINNDPLFSIQDIRYKDLNYGIFNVFYKNFLSLNKKYLAKHRLSFNTYRFLKRDVLLNYFLPWIIAIKTNVDQYDAKADRRIITKLWSVYWYHPYFTLFLVRYIRSMIKTYYVRKLRQSIF